MTFLRAGRILGGWKEFCLNNRLAFSMSSGSLADLAAGKAVYLEQVYSYVGR
jgi:hypothetical protein